MATTFLSGERILAAVRAANAKHAERRFGVAYWGLGAVDRLGLGKDLSSTRVVCDLWSEGCDAGAILEMLRRGATIVSVEGFHAKTYLYPNRVVLGSANASRSGLGDEEAPPRRTETALLCDDGTILAEANVWFEVSCKKGTPVDEAMVEAARTELAAVREARRPSLLHALAHEAEALKGLDIWVTVYVDSGISDEANLTWAAAKGEYGDDDRFAFERDGVVPFYEVTKENLPASPPGRIYLDFTRTRKGKLAFHGIWKVRSGSPKLVAGNANWLVMLDQLPSLRGRKPRSPEMKALGEALAELPAGDRETNGPEVMKAARHALKTLSGDANRLQPKLRASASG